MRRRGHALVLMMLLVAAFGALGLGFASRQSVSAFARRESGQRLQALWAARSAVAAGRRGDAALGSRFGHVKVRVEVQGARTVATARLGQVKATVRADREKGSWSESVEEL